MGKAQMSLRGESVRGDTGCHRGPCVQCVASHLQRATTYFHDPSCRMHHNFVTRCLQPPQMIKGSPINSSSNFAACPAARKAEEVSSGASKLTALSVVSILRKRTVSHNEGGAASTVMYSCNNEVAD